MLLAIDIGNSNIVFGIFQQEVLAASWRMASMLHKTADEYASQLELFLEQKNISLKEIDAAILSSVVPPLTPTLTQAIEQICQHAPYSVQPEKITQLMLKVDHPEEVGADRLVNAVAAYQLYGGPCLIIDFGTATTFCAVSKQGEYLGGTITAGPLIIRDALTVRTAKLPKIELATPSNIIGTNTIHAIQAGLFYGTIDMVKGSIARFKTILGKEANVVATGGLIDWLKDALPEGTHVNPTLTLQGLQILHASQSI